MIELNKLESSVIVKLLDQPTRNNHQYIEHLTIVSVSSRRVTTAGFVTRLIYPSFYKSSMSETVRIGNVEANIQGLSYGAGFMLLIANGLLTSLEGYSFGEDWPENILSFDLFYQPSRTTAL